MKSDAIKFITNNLQEVVVIGHSLPLQKIRNGLGEQVPLKHFHVKLLGRHLPLSSRGGNEERARLSAI